MKVTPWPAVGKKVDLDPSETKGFAVLRHCGHEELMSPNFNVFHSIPELEKNVLKRNSTECWDTIFREYVILHSGRFTYSQCLV